MGYQKSKMEKKKYESGLFAVDALKTDQSLSSSVKLACLGIFSHLK
jgi:hypothetical protein